MSNPANAQSHIFNWSTDKPEWLRDALRRIVQHGKLIESDLDELEAICRQAHKAEKQGAISPVAQPLQSGHFPSAGSGQTAVSLVAIKNPTNVNRLPSTGKVPFGPSPGLTVIYGDNGAGKSGYARVLKRACRARGNAQEILPDVFEKGPKGKPSMEFDFSVGGKPQNAVWQEGAPSDARLSRVFVFDSASASHYLKQENAASFTPFGLDILPKLARAADDLAARLNAEESTIKDLLGAAQLSLAPPAGAAGTAVGKAIATLSGNTDEKVLVQLAGMTTAESERLEELRKALSSDSTKASMGSEAASKRVLVFAGKVADAERLLDDSELERYRLAVLAAEQAQESAKKFAEQGFTLSLFPGAGEKLWREMWAAADKFSFAKAYPGVPFPVTAEKAACVLCQQVLDDEAGVRLRAFRDSYSDQSQKLAAKLQEEVSLIRVATQTLSSLSIAHTQVEADLLGADESSRTQLSAAVAALEARRVAVEALLENGCAWGGLPALAGAGAILSSVAARLKQKAAVEAAAADPEARKKLVSEREELAAREWLASRLDIATAQVKRLARVDRLASCRKDLKTAPITAKNSELTEIFVTKAFKDQFELEVEALGLNTLKVVLLEAGGKKGETKFALRLAQNTQEDLAAIASEGEQRCIALATFLAELSQSTDKSALVFDDPVSSLDYRFREAIAKRLAVEAAGRQVIVFTHDVCFLEELRSFAEAQNVGEKYLWLEWGGGAPGTCMEGIQWDHKGPKERLLELDKRCSQLAQAWNQIPSDANKRAIRAEYSLLRATLERVVEKELLGDVVARYRSQIKTVLLGNLIGISPDDVGEVQRLLKRCHEITDAHDASPKGQANIPTPADLAADIQAATSLLKSIRANVNQTKNLASTTVAKAT